MAGSWGTGHWEALSTAPAQGDQQDQVVSPGDRHRDHVEVGEGTGKPGLRSRAALEMAEKEPVQLGNQAGNGGNIRLPRGVSLVFFESPLFSCASRSLLFCSIHIFSYASP